MQSEQTVTVNAEALRQVLSALVGPGYLIRELQAIRSMGNGPIDRLIDEFNAQVEPEAPQPEAKDARDAG